MNHENMITLLPNLGDTPSTNPQEKLKRLNIIMKLSNLQILKILGDVNNSRIKIKIVLKDGKIIGFRKINEDGKVEVIKCNSVKENIGNLYYKIDKFGVNMGALDYRLNLVNYKPEIKKTDIENIENLRFKVRIIEYIMKSNPSITNSGIKFKEKEVISKFPPHYGPIIKEFKESIDWKWMKYMKQLNDPSWLKKLYIQGYRPNDVFTMIHTGIINKESITEKEPAIEEEQYDVDIDSNDESTSKSRTFSRTRVDSSSTSTSTSPDVKDVKEIKKIIRRKSFKEYQMEKLNNSKRNNEDSSDENATLKKPCIKEEVEQPEKIETPSKPTVRSPVKNIPRQPKGLDSSKSLPAKPIPTKPQSQVTPKELIIEYQSKYKDYYRLYQELKGIEIKPTITKQERDTLNIKISKLVNLHNELESIRFRLN